MLAEHQGSCSVPRCSKLTPIPQQRLWATVEAQCNGTRRTARRPELCRSSPSQVEFRMLLPAPLTQENPAESSRRLSQTTRPPFTVVYQAKHFRSNCYRMQLEVNSRTELRGVGGLASTTKTQQGTLRHYSQAERCAHQKGRYSCAETPVLQA